MDSCLRPTVSSKALQATVTDLQSVNGWVGLVRFAGLGAGVISCLTLAWTTHTEILFWGWTVVAGVFYALWLICTHDAIHHTLLGWPVVERCLSRMISWPMLWPVGVYGELHRLHHGWNGLDLRDPERCQWTAEDYQQASPMVRWYVRHQWLIDIVVLGGFGIIAKTLIAGIRLHTLLPRLKGQIVLDLLGMGVMQACIISAVVLAHGSILRYLLFWLCLERVVGSIVQARAHLEHYGLWQQVGGHQLTQLYASRNLEVHPWIGWLVGGLNHHAVHHAFPGIPFNHLPEAHRRIQAVLKDQGMPELEMGPGYLKSLLSLMNQMTLIPKTTIPTMTPGSG